MSAFLLEPSPLDKRRSYSKILVGLGKPELEPLNSIRQSLKEMRRSLLGEADRLTDQVSAKLAADPKVKISFASDASEAVTEIERISGSTRTLAVNKSAVVAQELVPTLRSAGFRIVDSYYGELPACESRFNEYWQLPTAPSETIAESFTSTNLTALRERSMRNDGAKGFVGLLGVNAISASDGSVFFVQHFNNISKIFQQARKLILVVGLDKITKDRDDALFQAKCTGIFGWEVKLLGLGSRVAPEANLDDIPFEIPALECDSTLHIIVLDNGRRAILQSQYKDLFTCIGCRACIKSCPTYQFFGEKTQWSPKEYLYFFILRQNRSIDLCLGCGMCQAECPVGIDIPAMMLRARPEFKRDHSLTNVLLGNFERFARISSLMPSFTNSFLDNKLPRWFAEKTLGISKEVTLPKFKGDTFSKWFRSTHHST